MKKQTEKTALNLKKEKIVSFETLKILGGTGPCSNGELTTGRTQTTTKKP